MTIHSFGLLPWRRGGGDLEVLLGHMGGPYWERKDARAWSIPKGLPEPDEEPLETARREFAEELGLPAPETGYVDLGTITQRNQKVVRAWAVEHDLDPETITPGTFTMMWPPRSGRRERFPEMDRVRWMSPDEARTMIVAAQAAFVDRLLEVERG